MMSDNMKVAMVVFHANQGFQVNGVTTGFLWMGREREAGRAMVVCEIFDDRSQEWKLAPTPKATMEEARVWVQETLEAKGVPAFIDEFTQPSDGIAYT